MMRVSGDVFAEGRVALQAGGAGLHIRLELVIGPLPDAARIAGLRMHGMAGGTGHGSLTRLPAGVAGRPQEPVVFPPGDAKHPIGPEDALGLGPGQQTRIGVVEKILPRIFELVARAVLMPLLPPVAALIIQQPPHSVTLAADLGRELRGEPGRVDDRVIGAILSVVAVPAQGVPVQADVLLRRTMAGFAGDAKLGDPRIDLPRLVQAGSRWRDTGCSRYSSVPPKPACPPSEAG